MKNDETLTLKTVNVKEDTRKALIDALRELCSNDADFTGKNGPEYLWAGAAAAGFASNFDYLIDKLEDVENDSEMVEQFIHQWMDYDSYYKAREVEVIADSAGTIYFIVLAYVS